MIPASAKDIPGAIRELGARVGCELRTDRLSRVLYSTDASNHQVEPLAVAFPRDVAELAQVVAAAAELGLPLLPRGAGTSLAGQAVGRGVVLDLSRHLTEIGEPEPEAQFLEAGAGAVLAAVNSVAAQRGLMYGPDPASADRATVGGVVGNNASGSHSIRYGMTADHLEAAEVVLSDGSLAMLRPTTEAEAQRLASGSSLEAKIYRSALEIRSRYAAHVQDRWPHTWRRASGYSLNYLTGFHPGRPPSWYAEPEAYPLDSRLNLATLLCGSEGTLALVARARLRLVPRPRATALVVLPFREIAGACDAAVELLEFRPAVVELVPRTILERAGTVAGYSRRVFFAPPGAEALLLVEFAGASVAEASAMAGTLAKRGTVITDRHGQDDVWAVRKAGLGLLMSLPGDLKPIEFVEDAAVPVERLGEYVRRVDRLLASAGTRAEWYAHASAGCLHLRPLLNLKDRRDRERMRGIAESVLDIVVELKGSLSGEHGDGLSRTRYNEKLFGPGILQAFRELKLAWDPQGIMNPGKVVPLAGALSGPDEDLRPPIRADAAARQTWFAFRRELDWAHAAEACNGQGACLKNSGVMCPSYQALRVEEHSTRGRANALRAAFSGVLPPDALTGRELHAVLDLCLECKACKSECPSAVDMARMKAEFLAAYQAEHGVPLRARAFSEIHALAEWGQRLAPVVNALAPLRALRWLQDGLLGISKRRTLPRFAPRRFSQWFAQQPPAEGTPVVLFLDTYTETMCPEVGQAAVRVLEACGCQVLLAEGQGCCGRPMISKGLLRRARVMAERNLRALAPHAAAGTPIIGLEPSCLLTLRDEYLEFFPDDERAQHVADASLLIEEFLVRRDATGKRPLDRVRRWEPARVAECALHGHCYTKALVGMQPTLEMLQASGWTAAEIDAGCCGMAGSFGYEAEHADLSVRIAEQRLLPAVRAAEAQRQTVCASGFSCRSQIKDGTGVSALHPIQAVAAMLAKEPIPDTRPRGGPSAE